MPRRSCCGLALLLLPLLSDVAGAGPWPRDTGQHFLTFGIERDREGDSYTGLYGEYGLSRRVTLGYEFGHTNQGESSAMLWLQRAIGDGQGANRMSVAFGAGALRREGETIPMAQIAASWGRGFDGLWDGGWMAADLRIKAAGSLAGIAQGGGGQDYLTPEMTAKLDLTLGVRPVPPMMLIGQLRLERRRGAETSAKLAASVVRDVIGPLKLELGVVEPLSGPGERAVKLSSWIAF